MAYNPIMRANYLLIVTIFRSLLHKSIDLSSKMTNGFNILISLCGQISLFALQFSMLTTAIDIQRNGNEKSLSSVPYLCLLVNCVVWTIYATMRGLLALFIPNVIGVFIGFYCTLLFNQFSSSKIPLGFISLSSAVVLLAIIMGAAGSVGEVGLFAVMMSSVVYASPLATVSTVIHEKSTESMPFHTSILVWLSAACWTLYGGLAANDAAVLVSSLAGLVMASIQLFLYVLYGLPPDHR